MSTKLHGRLKIIKELPPLVKYYGKNLNKRKIRIVLCECICSNKIEVRLDNLNSGHTQSCGCYNKDQVIKAKTTHGLTSSALFRCYNNMMNRCYREEDINYNNYGGRGIKVCKEWRLDRNKFFEWALSKNWKDNLQIDRKNGNKGYYPWNCRFITRKQNANNKRSNIKVTIKGEILTLALACEKYGVNYHMAYTRISKGMEPEKAILTPSGKSENLK